MKLFHSSLSSLVFIIQSGSMKNTISDEDFKTIVNLTMVPEIEPISRSLVIKVISELIEKKKIELSLENISSQLWHLIR